MPPGICGTNCCISLLLFRYKCMSISWMRVSLLDLSLHYKSARKLYIGFAPAMIHICQNCLCCHISMLALQSHSSDIAYCLEFSESIQHVYWYLEWTWISKVWYKYVCHMWTFPPVVDCLDVRVAKSPNTSTLSLPFLPANVSVNMKGRFMWKCVWGTILQF